MATTSDASSFEAFDLSREQALAWIDESADERGRACVLAWIDLSGPLHDGRLRRALRAVTEAHEILRTVFHTRPGLLLPLQVVLPDLPPRFVVVDLTPLSLETQEGVVDRDLVAVAAQDLPSFDLTRGPLVEAVLYRLGASRHILRLAASTLCADARTLLLIARELAARYEAGTAVDAATDATLTTTKPLQYLEYVAFQEEWSASTDAHRSVEFWSVHAAMSAQYARFPAARVRDRDDERETHTVRLEAAARDHLHHLARQLDVSPRTLLLLCWQALLSRLSGTVAPRVDVSSDGRALDDLLDMPGPFSRTLPCATAFAAHHRLSDLAPSLERTLREMRSHQMAFGPDPRTGAVSASTAEAATGRVTGFDYLAWNARAVPFAALRTRSARDARFALHLCCTDTDAGVISTIESDPSACPPGEARRVGQAYEALLRSALDSPETPLSALALMTPEQSRGLLYAPSDVRTSATRPELVTRRFEACAARAPAAVVLHHGQRTVSAAALNELANRLARRLADRNIGVESRVALLAPPSVELVAVILAVLKRGAGYVPLDHTHPPDRLRFQIADSGATLTVTSDAARAADLSVASTAVVALDRLVEEAQSCSPENLSATPPGAATAYVIYTSGSTGKSKGVVVSHDALAAYIQWCLDSYVHPDGQGAPLASSLAFDLTVTSLFGPLVCGQPITLPGAEDPAGVLASALRATHCPFSWVKLTPSHLRPVAAQPEGAELSRRVHTLILGGEAITARDLTAWRQLMPDVTLLNEYGPTEATVGCSVARLGDSDAAGDPVSIGVPIPGARLYILDPRGEPLPPGFAGEIAIGGDCLARGYLARPGLTASRFVPNPWATTAGERLYLTGDLGRQREDGAFEFLGRLDHQVKLRGYRIEPGEIEALLRECTGVHDALVLPRSEEDGSVSLAAYLLTDDTRDEESLRQALQARVATHLPAYMTPASYTFLRRWPLTPNGKIDRSALPPPADPRASRSSYAAPRTPEEEVLCAVWSQVLGVERVGIDDQYFELGGDSIRALQIAGLAQDRGVPCTIELLFRHHTIRAIAAHIRRTEFHAVDQPGTAPFSLLSPEDRALLPDDAEDAFPLSRLQAGMIFHRELEPESAVYHDIFGYHLRLPLDLDALRTAVDLLVARHPMLRTSFHLSGYSEPIQIVHRQARNPLRVADISHLSRSEQEGALGAWIEEEKGREFDYSDPPLLWFQVHVRDAESFQFSLSFHHAIIDGWSDATMLIELAVSYAHLRQGKSPPFTTPATDYREFVALERAAVESAEQRDFWLRLLADATPLVIPRALASRPTDPDRGIVTRTVDIPPRVSDGLRRVARALAVPLKSVLLAAHVRVIACVSGAADVLTTITAVGRPETLDGDRVLGLHLNSIPFRLALGEGTWAELIRQAFVHEQETLPYRRFPLSEMQRLAGKGRLSETSFYYTHYHIVDRLRGVEGFEILGRLVYEETSFPLVANFGLDPWLDRVTLTLGADPTQFTDAQVERLGEYYLRALTAIAADEQRRYEQAVLLDDEQRRLVIDEWNDTSVAHTPARGVHELFDQQVDWTPRDTALVASGTSLTYAALQARANRLANHLRALGAGPDVLVALCLERSIDMPVAVLAVLKAGAAYVPLDPAYPQERRRFMLDDTRAPLIITQRSLRELVGCAEATIITLDGEADAAAIASAPAQTPDVEVASAHLGYVVYTSGSTGRPKGVALTHAALTNLVQWHLRALPGARRTLQFASLSFDASFHEMFAAWCAGGTVVLIDEETRRDVPRLARTLRDERIEKVILPGAVLQQLVDTGEARTGLPDLREIIATGDRLQVSRGVMDFLLAHPEATLHNHYGPSETHVVTAWTLADRPERCPVAPPIGLPIDNCTTFILDAHIQPAPIGTPGELYLGGPCLARGYLVRPAATAERFVPNPFPRAPGERLYRTGDVARRLHDGSIEFIGRRDHQVKIRGHRVEPGEVEAAIQQHPDVKDVIVLARNDPFGDKQLIAYVVPTAISSSASAEPTAAPATTAPATLPVRLRQHLAACLPDYMIPAAFVELDALPLTANGKVDRAALPGVEISRAASQRAYVAPRTGTEEVVAAVWRDLLGVAAVGVHDDFFELGGHSLLATRVVAALRRTTGVELPLRLLFDTPTVAGLADAIQQRLTAGVLRDADMGSDDDDEGVTAREERTDAPLSFAQERLWIVDQLQEGESTAYHIAAALALDGTLDVLRLRRSLAALVSRHAVFRTRIVAQGGEPQLLTDVATARPLMMVVDLGESPTPEVDRDALADRETRRPFSLANDWPLRVTLLRLSPVRHALLVTLHHVAADGWTLELLVRELAALYEAGGAPRRAGLPDVTWSYTDYARWQRTRLRGPRLDALLAHWTTALEGAPSRLTLPADGPPAPGLPRRGARVPVAVPPHVTRALKSVARHHGATLFMVVLAAYATLLGRLAGQPEVCIGTPIANRRRLEWESLAGFFANTLVLRCSLDDRPTWRELLARVRSVTLDAYAHQDLPFDRLVDALTPPRSVGVQPLFQAMLAWEQAPMTPLVLSDLTVTPLPSDANPAKFDLTLLLREAEGGLTGSLEYDPDRFSDRRAAHWADLFQQLLAVAAEDPDRPIDALPLFGTETHPHVPAVGRGPTVSADACVHHLFDARADAQPEASAVIDGRSDPAGRRGFSYGDLRTEANLLAHALITMGMRPEDRVAVCLDRGLELTPALLGVLKAGCAYVPLDPAYPREHLATLFARAEPSALVTTSDLLTRLPPVATAVPTLLVDQRASWRDTAPRTAPRVPASPDQLAYVMFTSGSTGGPKAVAVPHRAIVRLVRDTSYATLDARDTVLQFAPVSFDASVFEIWGALLNGARLLLAPPGLPSLDELANVIACYGVTTLWTTAGLFAQLVDTELPQLTGLRQWLAGGDVLPPAQVRRATEALPNCRLINGYGPTENTTFTCCHAVDRREVFGAVPIGRPVANTTVHVLDAACRPVPADIVGELYATGDGLARGYSGDPRGTAERFVPDPFTDVPGQRMYRTGDLVRWRFDGTLDFVGRRDQQVKIRGFRVEPSEVAAALSALPDVRQAAAIVRRDEAFGTRLLAYVVCELAPEAESNDASWQSSLRDRLAAMLPEHMLPHAIAVLDALPLTPNGKVDLRALPDPPTGAPSAPGAASPRTPTEDTLLDLFHHVLPVRARGIEESFFGLGGDSIQVLQLVARANAAGLRFAPKQVFEHPTVAALAAVAHHTGRALPASDAAPVEGPVAPTPMASWFFEQRFANAHHWNQSVRLTAHRPITPTLVRQAFLALVRHHDALRSRFSMGVDGGTQEIAPFTERLARTCFSHVDLHALDADLRSRVRAELERQAQAGLSLESGPLARAIWFDGGPPMSGVLAHAEQDGREPPDASPQPALTLIAHHLVIDGYSWRVLLHDFEQALALAAEGRPHLAAKTVSVQQWAAELAAICDSPALSSALDYWRAQAASAEPRRTRDDAPRNLAGESRTVSFAIETIGSDGGATVSGSAIEDWLLAALSTAHCRWTGDDRLLVALEHHGRDAHVMTLDVSRTVGWFTALFPLVFQIDTVDDPASLLASVRRQRRAVPHDGFSYGLLRYLHPDERVRHDLASLAPNISLNYLGQFDKLLSNGSFRFDGLPAEPHAPVSRRPYPIDVTASIWHGQLQVAITYSPSCHAPARIESLADLLRNALVSLRHHLTTAVPPPVSTVDQAEIDLDQDALDRLLNTLEP